jgi:hypothetical protein
MKVCFIVLLLATACFTGCGKPQTETRVYKTNDQVVLKILVLQSGEIRADGRKTSLADLDQQLSEIEKQHGVVWLSCESRRGKAARVALDVSGVVSDHRVPLKRSNTSDFSDM